MKNIYFIPFDRGADFTGAYKGVYRILESLQKEEIPKDSYLFDIIEDKELIKKNGKIDSLCKVQKKIETILKNKEQLLIVSGDHSVTFFLYQIVTGFFGTNLPLIILDAHSDASLEYEGWINHGCFVRTLYKICNPEIYHIGVRYDPMKLKDIEQHTFPSFSFCNADANMIESIKSLVGDRKCYVSIDIDVLDPVDCPGVFFPVLGGINESELFKILEELFSLNVAAVDLVEYVPEKDIRERTLSHAINIIKKWLER